MEENLVKSETAQKILTKDTACPSLPVKYRIWGFITCFLLGFLISILTMLLFFFGDKSKASRFAIIYTVGNIASLLATFFLIGPMRQLKLMFKKTRIIATIMCLFCIIFTVVFALTFYDREKAGHNIIMWILIILQYIAMFWYVLSYIPFARTICLKCCKCLCNCDDL